MVSRRPVGLPAARGRCLPRRSPLSESVLSPRLTAATAMALARAVLPAGREGRHHPHRTQTCLGVPSGAPCGGLASVRAGPPRAACPGRPAVQPSWAHTSQPSLQGLFSLVSPRLNGQNTPCRCGRLRYLAVRYNNPNSCAILSQGVARKAGTWVPFLRPGRLRRNHALKKERPKRNKKPPPKRKNLPQFEKWRLKIQQA